MSCRRTSSAHLSPPQIFARRSRAAYLHGVSPRDNKQVKETKAIVWIPQRGNNNSVELPSQLPRDDFLLKDLGQLG